MKNKNLYIIGVTGSICSGKSACIKYLSSKPDCHSINLDIVTHEIYKRNFIFHNNMKRIFGKNIVKDENTFFEEIARKELGKIVFNNKDKIDILNKLIRPEIIYQFSIFKDNLSKKINKKTLLLVEGALLTPSSQQEV
jgi:dephospho-CoA kinase